jgi:hypothetical protein
MAGTIESERREASTARVPSVPPGKAIVYTRYEQEKTVVMNPDDFHRLAAIDQALADITADAPAMSELALKAHEVEDTPGASIEDPAEIKAHLGL